MKEKLRLHIAVCDDEPEILRQLEEEARRILEDTYELSVCASSTAEGILSGGAVYQLALLDVQLKQSDGVELARKLLLDNPDCRIIFVSGHTSVVSTVYEVPHYCMVLKDQIPEQLPKFLHRAADEAAQEAGQILQIRVHKKTVDLKLSDIVCLERRGHLTTISLKSGEQLVIYEKLGELTDRIASPYFCRCHISYVVNLLQIAETDGRYLKMKTGQQIPVSHRYEEATWQAYSRYLKRAF